MADDSLFVDAQHMLIATCATIAAENGIERTRQLVDAVADNDALWEAIAVKVGLAPIGAVAVAPAVDVGDLGDVDPQTTETEPPPPAGDLDDVQADGRGDPDVVARLLNGDDGTGPVASEPLGGDADPAGPDATEARPVTAPQTAVDDVSPPDDPIRPDLLEANGTGPKGGKKNKKAAHPS